MKRRAMRYSENCVYAVATPIGVKIGFTSRLGDRLTAFQREHGVACYPIVLTTGLSRSEAMDLERDLHRRCGSLAIKNEYFEIEHEEVIAMFASSDQGAVQ